MIRLISVCLLIACCTSCSENTLNPFPPNNTSDVDFWLSRPDGSALLEKQTNSIRFAEGMKDEYTIEVDPAQTYQTVDGFGYTLTGGSAHVLSQMTEQARKTVLKEIFSSGDQGLGVSFLRISIGASDLNAFPFTYHDGQDATLAQFSLQQDAELIAVLKEILVIRPGLKILGTPWSAPAWMKDNAQLVGGRLLPAYYSVFSQYIVKYIEAMKEQGIAIYAITPQNEPLNEHNNPSMLMSADEQNVLIRDHMGPLFKSKNLNTKIITYDHNCDHPEYPIHILKDAGTRAFVAGSAFHLYAGDISCLSQVRDEAPEKEIHFTEQYTASNGNFGGDLKWHMRNVVIGALRNWSRTVLEWNFATDARYGPFTDGGCSTCKGALTIEGDRVTRNVSYYIIGQVAKFVPPGSVRVSSNSIGNVLSVAFVTPEQKNVLLVMNDNPQEAALKVRFAGKQFNIWLASGDIATYVWK